ncbi:hypothetical protein PLICRDRAFT_161069 [Plicaturopsis crispa FD-325 SS-3]|nr:hypothetical protein PLICRDRAFT_161069 [Plicaturopsis crispa FD-325 SS-3]
MARMHTIDEIIHLDAAQRRSEWQQANALEPSTPSPSNFAPLPGPWGFMTSGYLLGLIIMAVVCNRIQNIVSPSRNPFRYRLARQGRSRMSIARALWFSVFPLDLSSTTCRIMLRIPTLYFLGKVLFLWSVVLLQVSGFLSSEGSGWLQTATSYVAELEMEDICWRTFGAVCGAIIVDGFNHGLEGASANVTPFNLFGYAFMLHIYSSPMTHANKGQGMASRPDKHVVVTILLPLLQLTVMHFLGVKQRWSRQRLIPSAIIGLTALTHFHTVVWFSKSSYPLLNYMPCIFETSLLLITLITISLNALTQVLLEGAVTRPLFGHQATLLPKLDEDFSVVLIRLGTASLEATSVAGLGNEVGGVSAAAPADEASRLQVQYGTVEISHAGVSAISPATEWRGRRKRARRGFGNEIRDVKTTAVHENAGELWIDYVWYRELTRLGAEMVQFAKGVWRLLRYGPRSRRPAATPEESREPQPERDAAGPVRQEDPQVYERFLRGDNVSDDDTEFDPSGSSPDGSGMPSGSDTDEDIEDDDEGEAMGLYTDLSTATPASAPLLLAHMTDSSTSPLTRRRYSQLVAHPLGGDDPARMETLDVQRKRAEEEDQASLDSRLNCVICTAEPRQIICWPCRCLALCDDCRENLASRSSAAKHACPCCRRSVEGYSRIFIP